MDGSRRHLLRHVGTALGLTLMTSETSAAGKARKLRVDIRAGNAPATLAEFIQQTGLQVLFEADAIRGHPTHAVSGLLDAAEALRMMLEGSGLIFEFINERTVAVRPQPAVTPAPTAEESAAHL